MFCLVNSVKYVYPASSLGRSYSNFYQNGKKKIRVEFDLTKLIKRGNLDKDYVENTIQRELAIEKIKNLQNRTQNSSFNIEFSPDNLCLCIPSKNHE